jgi:hypothetical protein
MKDALLRKTKAFPAAAAANNCDTIDLGTPSGVGGQTPDNLEVKISWPALANLVDDKTVTFDVRDSANDSSYAAVGLSYVITGAGGMGVAAGSVTLRLPASFRRYLRVYSTVLTGGGNNTASEYTVELLTH